MARPITLRYYPPRATTPFAELNTLSAAVLLLGVVAMATGAAVRYLIDVTKASRAETLKGLALPALAAWGS